ncbi:hypothetical protein B0H10DRAFT_1954267 [Mycena sp. CBHHK59/15]|nr:hypothetical protein B0H10DRAFT_1954267 [Mycena sp. CBHHK59/15]
MTLDEAQLILNVKHGERMEKVLEVGVSCRAVDDELRDPRQSYEHLFKTNSPPPKPQPSSPGKQPSIISHSHYLQSKVVRAWERIEAELPTTKPPPGPEVQPSPPPEAP